MSNVYKINGMSKMLIPLTEVNFEELFPIFDIEDIKKQSLLYSNYNIAMSLDSLRKLISEQDDGKNRLYIIKDNESEEVLGLIGITDIDWIQQRGNIILLMEKKLLIKKESHEPVKLLLIKSMNEWNMRKLIFPVYKMDTYTTTVLKGFGFKGEGTLTEYVRWVDEYFDVELMGLVKNDFHYVEV
jgi:RimJ/RimL family protein N-acetyltransferase